MRLPLRQQAKIKQAMKQAMVDLADPQLRTHELKGDYADMVSISAGGDLRIHLRLTEEDGITVAILQAVGTHSQLYG